MATRFAQSPAFANALYSAYNPGQMVNTGLEGRSIQSQQAATADADVANAIRIGEAKVAGAEYIGAGTVAQGQAAGHSAMMGGISSGISGIAGGLGSMGGGGGAFDSPAASPGGSAGVAGIGGGMTNPYSFEPKWFGTNPWGG